MRVAGFRYHRRHDVWEYPTGQQLKPIATGTAEVFWRSISSPILSHRPRAIPWNASNHPSRVPLRWRAGGHRSPFPPLAPHWPHRSGRSLHSTRRRCALARASAATLCSSSGRSRWYKGGQSRSNCSCAAREKEFSHGGSLERHHAFT